MTPIVLIQCRSSSSRLPGKALLPVRGMPSAILCARRAANTGLDVRIVTSTDPGDDELCELLKAARVTHFRGDLENVLARFKDALDGVAGATPVVRLTADNTFVDGALIDEALSAFHDQGKGYLTLHPPAFGGTPYGLGVEVFAAGTLRAAHAKARDAHDREHVTPWIIRTHGLNTHRPKDLKPGQSHLRCTMDSWADYRRLTGVFGRVSADPVIVTWQELCDRLHAIGPAHGIPQRMKGNEVVAELALGSAQLGQHYGIVNIGGQPSFETAKDLVHQAIACGVTHLDCAAAYGVAEARLGRIVDADHQFRATIVTKLSPLTQLSNDAREHDIRSHVEASVYRSCVRLNLRVLPYLLLHRWRHRTSHDGVVWETLRQLRDQGVIRHLGASVQDAPEASQAIADTDVKFIQLPFNVLDRRFQESGFAHQVKTRTDVVVQARSVFLQGLLLSPAKAWPQTPGVSAAGMVNRLNELAGQFNRDGIADLCIAYVRAQGWIDCMVLGMENESQLDQNVALFQNPPLQADECAEIEDAFPDLPEKLLNPALWPERNQAE